MLTGAQLRGLADANGSLTLLSSDYVEFVTRARDLAPSLALARDLQRTHDRSLSQGLALTLHRNLAGAADKDLIVRVDDSDDIRDVIRDLALDIELGLDLAVSVSINHGLALDLLPAREIASSLVVDLDVGLAGARGLALELALKLEYEHARYDELEPEQNATVSTAVDVLSRVASIIYVLLGAPYPPANRQPDLPPVVSPATDIRSTSEDVARMVNRAVDEGMDDAQIRLYDKWIQEGSGIADPAIIDQLVRLRIGAYEPVVRTLAGDTADDVIPALQAAARDAPHDEQLGLVVTNLEEFTGRVEETSARLTADSTDPYLPDVLDKIDHHAGRTAATLERLNKAIAAIAKSGGPAGRVLLNFGYTVTTGAATIAIAAAGVPMTGVLLADVGALVGALFARYLYARRRQTDPSLPPINPPAPDTDYT